LFLSVHRLAVPDGKMVLFVGTDKH